MPGNLDIPYLVVITYCAAIPLETFAKQTDKLGATHHSTYSSYFLSSSLLLLQFNHFSLIGLHSSASH